MTLSVAPPSRPPNESVRVHLYSHRVSPLAQTTFPACCAHYPGGLGPVRASVASRPMPPSPMSSRVGVHDFTFEACSGFTRVTACWVAQPPLVAFVTRLRLEPLPNQAACQLPDLPTSICVGLPPTGDLRSWGALDNTASAFPCHKVGEVIRSWLIGGEVIRIVQVAMQLFSKVPSFPSGIPSGR